MHKTETTGTSQPACYPVSKKVEPGLTSSCCLSLLPVINGCLCHSKRTISDWPLALSTLVTLVKKSKRLIKITEAILYPSIQWVYYVIINVGLNLNVCPVGQQCSEA